MPATLNFHGNPSDFSGCETLVIIGRKERLLSDQIRGLLPECLATDAWDDMVKRSNTRDNGRVISSYTGGSPRKVTAGILPESCSRHNTATRAWAIPDMVKAAGLQGNVAIILAVDDAEHAPAGAMAVARAHPTFVATSKSVERNVKIAIIAPNGPVTELNTCIASATGVRRAQALTDSPPSLLGCSAFVGAAMEVSKRLPESTIQIVRGEELANQGFGGVWGVGKAAADPPALVILEHAPKDATEHLCWVGKGIVYDTGGLSIKGKTVCPE